MITSRYNISSIKQLIDLNGKAVNFQLNFKVTSKSNENFDALVVTQEMLDSNEPLNYQKAEGEISGQIKNDNGEYNNYFLCLKSDKPMEVEVKIEINEIMAAPQQVQVQKQQIKGGKVGRQQELEEQYEDDIIVKPAKKPKFELNPYIVGAVVLGFLLIVGFTVYYAYRKKPNEEETKINNVDNLIQEGFNDLGQKLSKLNEVTSQVTDGLNQVRTSVNDDFGKLHHDLSENIQGLSERMILPDTTSDLGDIKESINNIKSHLYSTSSHQSSLPPLDIPKTPLAFSSAPPPSLLTTPQMDIINNADEILSRINSMKIKA